MLRKPLQALRFNALQLYPKRVLSFRELIRPTLVRASEIGYVSHGNNFITHIRSHSSSSTSPVQPTVDRVTFEQVCAETLDSLTEYFDELIEDASHLKSSDVAYSDGVLTVQFGKPFGTYVINRQSPNMQIWLSSPTSGPKRFDFIDNCWIYRHTGESLHELLDAEISEIVNTKVEFQQRCSHGKR